LRLGSETIDIPAGDARFVVQDQYVLPVDVTWWRFSRTLTTLRARCAPP
jgi:hypothetical protein